MKTAAELESMAVTVGCFWLGGAVGAVVALFLVGGSIAPHMFGLLGGALAAFIAHRVQR